MAATGLPGGGGGCAAAAAVGGMGGVGREEVAAAVGGTGGVGREGLAAAGLPGGGGGRATSWTAGLPGGGPGLAVCAAATGTGGGWAAASCGGAPPASAACLAFRLAIISAFQGGMASSVAPDCATDGTAGWTGRGPVLFNCLFSISAIMGFAISEAVRCGSPRPAARRDAKSVSAYARAPLRCRGEALCLAALGCKTRTRRSATG